MTASAYLTTISPAAEAFDRCASAYDELFTHSLIGRAQRNQVWPRLLAAFPTGSRILELNCGTGNDARFLAEHGRTVLACDASSRMISVARRRSHSADVEFLQLANEDLHRLSDRSPFDGAFSNFSGLNCVSDLKPVAADLAALLGPDARLLVCLWSRLCAAECIWYSLQGSFAKAFRRISGHSDATIGGLRIPVFYPTVSTVREAFSPWFSLRSRQAIGLFVPPSYAEPWIRSHPNLLATFERLDRVCATWPIFRGLGDHVLLEFVRCNR